MRRFTPEEEAILPGQLQAPFVNHLTHGKPDRALCSGNWRDRTRGSRL
jgi:hypothetical protein